MYDLEVVIKLVKLYYKSVFSPIYHFRLLLTPELSEEEKKMYSNVMVVLEV